MINLPFWQLFDWKAIDCETVSRITYSSIVDVLVNLERKYPWNSFIEVLFSPELLAQVVIFEKHHLLKGFLFMQKHVLMVLLEISPEIVIRIIYSVLGTLLRILN